MKIPVMILIISLVSHCSFASSYESYSSVLNGPTSLNSEAAEHAKSEFEQLNFFADGRGMNMSPGLITYFNGVMAKAPAPASPSLNLRTWFTRRWGLNFNNEGLVVGLFDQEYKGLRVGAVGCVACHSGRAAGELIIGLGNKNIDVVRMAQDVNQLEGWWKTLVPDSKKSTHYKAVEDAALDFSSYLGDEQIGNLTQGLVPISFIRGWFYRVHKEAIPKSMHRGQVKVPFLWGYEKKREVGLFCDGYGDGDKVGWAVAVELAAGQKPEVIRKIYDEVEKAEELFNQFLPPAYPFEVDQPLANKGHTLFNRTCAKCHGEYERNSQGYPIYESPKFVSWLVVQTDQDRILGNTEEFNKMVLRSPLADIIKFTDLGTGYFAPRLDGVWSRFPYLHNGSVPTVMDLLSEPAERPQVFSLRDSGEKYRFDATNLGLTRPQGVIQESSIYLRGRSGDRAVYFTERIGHSNQGHDFYTDLSEPEKAFVSGVFEDTLIE